ncbi:Fe-S-containing hydro-lyase [Clostridium tepidum]|jgi:fumarate hydratase subunit beta|uniref:Fumarate hydratase n=1 Tax=Clostridium tepidum TaxID=1962263 RepID=A0A1S9IG50_9CLOT|nr:Fe-S-containing hydro-lyase [Clostridium tepidum]MCR1934477.1 Fe-S-containing hydro-lyase [Clostridium tepidum]MDU6878086.1 Fe-S-containing hydro-lyase [Clostridium botulinum]OOO62397.1 fumarate hydratase [Clostridium tepidum]OOO69309.1 fumarate hydratase [Clostridium tepidum]
MKIKINTPLTEDKIKDLKAGDIVLITGVIYTARDAAHKRLVDSLEKGKDLPFQVENSIIYYVGPTPAKPGREIGAAGPTTSYRMDTYTPKLLNLGLKGMIGKGKRSKKVIESIVKNKAVYFGAIGGAAALISKSIKKSEIIAYKDLDSEAIRKLEVEDLPVTVIIDSKGNNLYESGMNNYLKSLQ